MKNIDEIIDELEKSRKEPHRGGWDLQMMTNCIRALRKANTVSDNSSITEWFINYTLNTLRQMKAEQ